jgi:hypothetical protein
MKIHIPANTNSILIQKLKKYPYGLDYDCKTNTYFYQIVSYDFANCYWPYLQRKLNKVLSKSQITTNLNQKFPIIVRYSKRNLSKVLQIKKALFKAHLFELVIKHNSRKSLLALTFGKSYRNLLRSAWPKDCMRYITTNFLLANDISVRLNFKYNNNLRLKITECHTTNSRSCIQIPKKLLEHWEIIYNIKFPRVNNHIQFSIAVSKDSLFHKSLKSVIENYLENRQPFCNTIVNLKDSNISENIDHSLYTFIQSLKIPYKNFCKIQPDKVLSKKLYNPLNMNYSSYSNNPFIEMWNQNSIKHTRVYTIENKTCYIWISSKDLHYEFIKHVLKDYMRLWCNKEFEDKQISKSITVQNRSDLIKETPQIINVLRSDTRDIYYIESPQGVLISISTV